MFIIPAIDLKNGQCVRLKQGQFDKVSVYDVDALTLAKKYKSLGARYLHVVDLDGAKTGCMQQRNIIKDLTKSGLKLQIGGGIRSLDVAKQCLSLGAETLVLGSIALTSPETTGAIINEAGPKNIILAFDIHMENGLPLPAIYGWQQKTAKSLWDLVAFYQDFHIQTILCTDIGCDGMMQGPNFALYEEALRRFPQISWQASGGIRHKEDIEQLAALKLAAVILGRMLYESDVDVQNLMRSFQNDD